MIRGCPKKSLRKFFLAKLPLMNSRNVSTAFLIEICNLAGLDPYSGKSRPKSKDYLYNLLIRDFSRWKGLLDNPKIRDELETNFAIQSHWTSALGSKNDTKNRNKNGKMRLQDLENPNKIQGEDEHPCDLFFSDIELDDDSVESIFFNFEYENIKESLGR